MEKIHGAAYCSLHVRKSNKAAIALYKETLGFEVARIEKKYCEYFTPIKMLTLIIFYIDGDGEDALYMRLYFDPEENQTS
jgi:peptide alpha-N-acetyltransferase